MIYIAALCNEEIAMLLSCTTYLNEWILKYLSFDRKFARPIGLILNRSCGPSCVCIKISYFARTYTKFADNAKTMTSPF